MKNCYDPMKVCYFGPYDRGHPRSRTILKGLRENDVEVVECNSVSSVRFLDYVKLLIKHQRLNYDVIILGSRGEYSGQPLVPIIKRLTRKPVVFDAVLTLSETNVIDRKLLDEKSIRSRFLYLLDYWALKSADQVLSDTVTHSEYYSEYYGIDLKKFRRLLISADDGVFFPMESSTDKFLVMFWGGFIPLQGVKYIVEAAKLLERQNDITFELRGFGQTYDESIELSKKLNCQNITFIPKSVAYEELPKCIAKASVCLGVFGETQKAKRVIPNKAVETLAMKKPLITGDSPAAREILKNETDCILVPMANPKAIADAVLELKEDKRLRDKIAQNGFMLFKKKLSPKVIGNDLKMILTELTENSK